MLHRGLISHKKIPKDTTQGIDSISQIVLISGGIMMASLLWE